MHLFLALMQCIRDPKMQQKIDKSGIRQSSCAASYTETESTVCEHQTLHFYSCTCAILVCTVLPDRAPPVDQNDLKTVASGHSARQSRNGTASTTLLPSTSV